MALDKNYIDTTDASVLGPAIKYYKHHGKRYYKFLTNYYLGRIYENAGDYDASMENFVRAGFSAHNVSPIYKARLYAAKERVYIAQFAYDKALEEAKKLKEITSSAKDDYDYAIALLDVATLQTILRDSSSAISCIQEYEDKFKPESENFSNRLYRTKLHFFLAYQAPEDSVISTISKYEESEGEIDWLTITASYCYLNEFEKAENALTLYENNPQQKYQSSYLFYKSQIEETKGNLAKSSDLLKASYDYLNENVRYAFEHKVKYIEEIIKRQKLITNLSVSSVIVLSLIIFLILLNKKSKRENLLIRNEYESIKSQMSMLNSSKDQATLEKERLKKEIGEQVESLIAIISKDAKNPNKMFINELAKKADDKIELVETVADFYSLRHEKFYNTLQSAHLSKYEIGVCCLLCMGFSGKELPDVVGKKNVYNIFSTIREKLGIRNYDSHLDKMLLQMLREDSE